MKLRRRPETLTDRLKIGWVLGYWEAVNWLIFMLQRLLFQKNDRPKKILVFRTGSIGDSVCALPAISHLKKHFKDAEIHLLTNAGKGRQNLVSMSALAGSEVFDRIINYENIAWPELTRQLRREYYDLVVHLTQYDSLPKRIFRDMFYFRLAAGIRSGFGWQMDRVMAFRQIQEKNLCFQSERERLKNILQKNGIPTASLDAYPLRIEAADSLKISELLASLPLADRPAIAVVPGAKRPQNRWPVEYFRAVIRHFCGDFNIFLIGGPDDAELAAPLLDLPNTFSFCGQLTPIQGGLLMLHCQIVLSNDTGPMHLAYAFGVPVVALFSNRDFPNRWFPPENESNVVLRATDVHCSVCFSETCTNNICMKKIPPETVIERLNKALTRQQITAA